MQQPPAAVAAPAPTKPKPARKWAPRFIEGTDVVTWSRWLWDTRFKVHPKYWYIAGFVSAASTMNLVLRWLQTGIHGRDLARVPLARQPVFVIGHWRTGTTLLHELLIQDPQFNYPDTFECFCPNHSILSERFFKTYVNWLAPQQRPMDNMAAGWGRPQEDEFALCLLGLPSPYLDVVFPRAAPMHPGSLDLSGLTPVQLALWKRTFRRFLQAVSFRDDRRLVLKSPPHTARIPVLLEMFPDARFVHIVRDPYVVFPSTLNLWRSLTRRQCVQTPPAKGYEEKVLGEFRTIYDRLEEARPLLKPGRFHELRYEDLVKDPVGELKKVYAGLELDGFDSAKPRVEAYLAQTGGYETNKYAVTPEQREEVTRRWGDVIRRYGYA